MQSLSDTPPEGLRHAAIGIHVLLETFSNKHLECLHALHRTSHFDRLPGSTRLRDLLQQVKENFETGPLQARFHQHPVGVYEPTFQCLIPANRGHRYTTLGLPT